MNQAISSKITNQEFMRIVDLALRRVMDNEKAYSAEEQIMFKKMRNIKSEFAKKYGRLL